QTSSPARLSISTRSSLMIVSSSATKIRTVEVSRIRRRLGADTPRFRLSPDGQVGGVRGSRFARVNLLLSEKGLPAQLLGCRLDRKDHLCRRPLPVPQ